ncbi:thiol peroxidase [Marinobacter sp.]|uniref:thiol peroxidase n=1 Tax=Marinobacter sp. TaxID=50741 RepID=UPI00384CED3A
MATVTRRGVEVSTAGSLPPVGQAAPEANFTQTDLSELTLSDLKGSNVILNIFPSIDTPTCAKSVRRFNEAAARLDNTRIVCVSADLPFAQSRFCGAEGLDQVQTVSTFRNPEFGTTYGVEITDGPLRGLLARAIVIIDAQGVVTYTELVPEIGQEPDYGSALESL